MPSRKYHNEQSNPLFPIISDEGISGKKIPCVDCERIRGIRGECRLERNGEKSLGRKNQRGIVERKGQDLSFPQASLWEWWNNPRVKGNICKVIHVFHRKVWINRGLGCEKHKFFRGIWRKSKRKGAGEAQIWWKYVVLWLKSYPQFPQVGVENCGMSVWRCGELTGRNCGDVESAGFSTGEGMNSLGGTGRLWGKESFITEGRVVILRVCVKN